MHSVLCLLAPFPPQTAIEAKCRFESPHRVFSPDRVICFASPLFSYSHLCVTEIGKEKASFIEEVASNSEPQASAPPTPPPPPLPAPPHEPLAPTKLRWQCNEDILAFQSTADEYDPTRLQSSVLVLTTAIRSLIPFEGVIGQERALGAIEVGLGIEARGFNLFLTGLAGTGRLTTIRSILDTLAVSTDAEMPPDQLYVTNFGEPDVPLHVALPAGRGKEFADAMKQLVSSLGPEIKQLFDGPAFEQSRKGIEENSSSQQRSILSEFERLIEPEGLSVFQVQGLAGGTQLQVIPKIKDKPVRPQLLDQLVEKEEISKEEAEAWRAKVLKYSTILEVEVKRMRIIQNDALRRLEELESATVAPLIKQKVAELKEKFPFEQLSEYFKGLESSLLRNASQFKNEKMDSAATSSSAGGLGGLQALLAGASRSDGGDFRSDYNVNLLVDNSQSKTRPVVFETHPTYKNLFGTIERVFTRFGSVQTDLSNIKPGTLLKANGGFLVLNARDVLTEYAVWPTLKRMLRNGVLEIQTSDMFFSTAMKPKPIPISVKVVMIGENYMYNMLSAYDEDFSKIFKVKVGFDYETSLTSDAVTRYASVIKHLCNQNKFRPLDRTGVAAIVENAVRSAGRQNKISTQLSTDVHDVIAEANFWATKESAPHIKRDHVQRALDSRVLRLSLGHEKLLEMIKQGYLIISVQGSKVGQVNALSVYRNSSAKFGRPSRITAITSLGRNGIVDIEREAKLTGSIHTKGVLILSSYLRFKYAQSKFVLTLSASIAFEQSYGQIDGDSASSTEAYAILSSLSGLPLKQNIAVTGSISQVGEVQPIGGVNEKIEGFFDTCKILGFTGDQGVLIPAKNVPDLMLRGDVVKAVEDKQFFIYAVENVDQGIEILTGVKAGAALPDGSFEPNTVHGLVYDRLFFLAKTAAQSLSPAGAKDEQTKIELAKMLLRQSTFSPADVSLAKSLL